jgi:hypothetical protein
MAQLLWVPRYIDDIESDMSVFHQADDALSMSSALFFKRAARLVAYDGAMQKRLIAEQRQETAPGPSAPEQAHRRRRPPGPDPARRVPDSSARPVTGEDLNDPVLAKIFDFG